ncbi:NAD(P)-dependent oxidoreductase [Schleiferiaceae bacterium]|nr:NAD(P)-dependent oxidoreductase [Schleiferiaceae bacterium]
MKLIVLGAGGYIGSRVLHHFSNSEHELYGLFRNSIDKSNQINNCHGVIVGDLNDTFIRDQILEYEPQVIINLIALNQEKSEQNIRETLLTNVGAIWSLTDMACKKGLEFTLINFSSIHVYGARLNGGLLKENNHKTPTNNYGITHSFREDVLNKYNSVKGTNIIHLRLSNSYGEPVVFNNDAWKLVVNDLIKSAFIEKCIRMRGDGSAIRDFIHYSDYLKVLDKIITLDKPKSSTYNLSSGYSLTILSLAFLIRNVYKERNNVDIPIYINENEEISIMPRKSQVNQVISNTQLFNDFGHFELLSLKEGINQIFNHLEETIS